MNQNILLTENQKNYDRFMINNKINNTIQDEETLFKDILKEMSLKNNDILNCNYNLKKSNNNKIIYNYEPLLTLDTPDLSDNFYYNIIDWSKENEICVGIHNNIHLLNPETYDSHSLYEYNENELISSLKFNFESNLLASATEENRIDLFDYKFYKKLRSYSTTNRSSTMEFTNNILFEGNKNGQLIIRDIRSNQSSEYIFNTHSQEIVKIKLNYENNYIASGGNDNLLNVLDLRTMNSIFEVQGHNAAIKALSWVENKSGILVSGGGMGDNSIKVWNVNNKLLVNKIKTNNQVCNIDVLPNNQIISTHGFQDNKIEVRELENLDLVASFKSHEDRIIYYSSYFDKRKNQMNFITGSSDETIKLWNWKCQTRNTNKTQNLNFLR